MEQTTRRRGNDDPSLLDLILADESMQVSEISHHAPLGKSNHSLITFDFHCYLDFIRRKERYCFDRGNYEGMRDKLETSNWKNEYLKTNGKTTVEDKSLSLNGCFKGHLCSKPYNDR